jgi:hypothetical protein
VLMTPAVQITARPNSRLVTSYEGDALRRQSLSVCHRRVGNGLV